MVEAGESPRIETTISLVKVHGETQMRFGMWNLEADAKLTNRPKGSLKGLVLRDTQDGSLWVVDSESLQSKGKDSVRFHVVLVPFTQPQGAAGGNGDGAPDSNEIRTETAAAAIDTVLSEPDDDPDSGDELPPEDVVEVDDEPPPPPPAPRATAPYGALLVEENDDTPPEGTVLPHTPPEELKGLPSHIGIRFDNANTESIDATQVDALLEADEQTDVRRRPDGRMEIRFSEGSYYLSDWPICGDDELADEGSVVSFTLIKAAKAISQARPRRDLNVSPTADIEALEPEIRLAILKNAGNPAVSFRHNRTLRNTGATRVGSDGKIEIPLQDGRMYVSEFLNNAYPETGTFVATFFLSGQRRVVDTTGSITTGQPSPTHTPAPAAHENEPILTSPDDLETFPEEIVARVRTEFRDYKLRGVGFENEMKAALGDAQVTSTPDEKIKIVLENGVAYISTEPVEIAKKGSAWHIVRFAKVPAPVQTPEEKKAAQEEAVAENDEEASVILQDVLGTAQTTQATPRARTPRPADIPTARVNVHTQRTAPPPGETTLIVRGLPVRSPANRNLKITGAVAGAVAVGALTAALWPDGSTKSPEETAPAPLPPSAAKRPESAPEAPQEVRAECELVKTSPTQLGIGCGVFEAGRLSEAEVVGFEAFPATPASRYSGKVRILWNGTEFEGPVSWLRTEDPSKLKSHTLKKK